jgi:transposase
MPKYIHRDAKQMVMVPLNLEKQLEAGSLAFSINEIIENKINIRPLEAKYKNDEEGRPAWDPKILLKIVLLAYSYGINTSRKIAKACCENITFIALSSWSTPHFTTIAEFISGSGEAIKHIFKEVLLVCEEMGLLGGTTFALDGCKLSSNASKEWSGTKEELKRKAAKFEEKIKQLLERHKQMDKEEGEDSGDEERSKREKQREKLNKKIEKIKRWLKENEGKEGKRGRELKSNITDNESAKMKGSHGMVQGYNGQAVVDEKYQVIVAAQAFGSGPEQELFEPMIEEAKGNLEYIKGEKGYLEGKKIIADTGYFTEDNLKRADEENLDVYIPDQQYRKRDERFKGKDKYNPKKTERYTKEDFLYDDKNDRYECPNGKIVRLENRNARIGRFEGRRYAAKESDCRECSMRKECLRSETTKKRYLFILKKKYNDNYSARMMEKIDTGYARDIYAKRMGIIEPVFGNICYNKKLNNFTLRTKIKVNIQWLLYCMVHNIEKIAHYGNELEACRT